MQCISYCKSLTNNKHFKYSFITSGQSCDARILVGTVECKSTPPIVSPGAARDVQLMSLAFAKSTREHATGRHVCLFGQTLWLGGRHLVLSDLKEA